MEAHHPTASLSLQAHLLGPVKLVVGESAIPERAWSRRSARSLLLLLLITPGHRLPRDQVLDLLWPTASPESADRELRKAVHALRRVLEPGLRDGRSSRFVRVGAEAVALQSEVRLWADVDVFEHALISAQSAPPHEQRQLLHCALALYGGDLLSEDPYAEWAEATRVRLRARYRQATLILAALDLKADEPMASVPMLEQLWDADHTDEDVLRALMRALTVAGEHEHAMYLYRRGLEAFRTELGAEPGKETRELANEIQLSAMERQHPLPRTIDIRPHAYVPAPPNALVGRSREMERLQDLLLDRDIRLVTITGPGGVGKTRLAQETARQLADDFADGACFVSMASIRDPSLVVPTIARALGLGESGTYSTEELIRAALGDRELLLVLDNLEQVIEAAPEIATLLEGCGGLTILATSREPMRVRAEFEFSLPTLAVPGSVRTDDQRLLMRYGAVELFLERARAVQGGRTLSEEDVVTIAGLCKRLDGLPLAIELAAAQTRTLTPEQLYDGLSDRFALLASRYRDVPARHRTMRSAVAWSHDLLIAAEQAFFRRLAVFVDGCSLEAVAAVCSSAQDVLIDTQVNLTALVERNLVLLVKEGPDPRYGQLETIREFGLERLAMSGEEEQARGAHAAYYLAFAERAEPELRGGEQGIWFDRLEAEHGNFRAALQWALEQQMIETAWRLSAALHQFWMARGYFTEGRGWLERALDYVDGPLPLRAAALSAAGSLAEHQNDSLRAEALHHQAFEAWKSLGDRRQMAASLDSLGNVAQDRGHYEQAIEFHEQALDLYRAFSDPWGIARALNNLGVVAYYQGAYEQAEALWVEGLSAMRCAGDRRAECQVLNNLGAIAFQRGDLQKAATLHEEALVLRKRLGDRQGIGSSLINLGEVAHQAGDLEGAAKLLEEGAQVMRDVDDERQTAIALLILSHVTREQGDLARAAASANESLSLFFQSGDRFGLAGALETAAGMLAVDRPEIAIQLFAIAAAIWEAIGANREWSTQAAYDRDLLAARQALDDDVFATAWDVGRSMTSQQAVMLATKALGGGND